MNSLQSAGSDIQLLIASHLAQAPSTSTAWVPAVRSLGSTNKYFRKLLTEANWLAPADVCRVKFSQAVRFTCPALRVLDLAEHFAPALPMEALKQTLQTLPRTAVCPDHSALPLMILNRAGERLQPAAKAELVAFVENSRYALPVDGDTQRWTFTKEEGEALRRLISECFGMFSRSTFNGIPTDGIRYFAEDCIDVIHGLPNGLKALAFHELVQCLRELVCFPRKGGSSAEKAILFDIESLIPQQWNRALTSMACFPVKKLPDCLNVISQMATPRTMMGICRQVIKLFCSFLDTLPEENRHWTRLTKNGCIEDLYLFLQLVQLLGSYTVAHGIQEMFLEAAERSGLITAAELQSPQALEKFRDWYKFDGRMQEMMFAILWRQEEEFADS